MSQLYLGANPHTVPGRFLAWDSDSRSSVTLSKSDVTSASQESWIWIEGYLNGNVPGPNFLYPDELLEQDGQRWEKWHSAVTDFLIFGQWNAGHWYHLAPFEGLYPLDAPPIAFRSGEIWSWDGREWMLGMPQPEHDGRFVAGTICAIRQSHDAQARIVGDQMICESCGLVTQLK
jgi:hypothetical protein